MSQKTLVIDKRDLNPLGKVSIQIQSSTWKSSTRQPWQVVK